MEEPLYLFVEFERGGAGDEDGQDTKIRVCRAVVPILLSLKMVGPQSGFPDHEVTKSWSRARLGDPGLRDEGEADWVTQRPSVPLTA